ncbi:MAG TPA: hypothetical protein VFH50_11460 [Acidimicrobiales bacterium]|nr:hypothetical protein [Acidimicrobiales bacterium]
MSLAAVVSLVSGAAVHVAGAAVKHPALTFGITHDLGPAGGEPSIQDDGHGHIYISTPAGILSSVGGTGVLLSRSLNDGVSFLPATSVGGPVGGEDSDVTSDATGHNVWVADLAAAFSNVVRSTDFGATFPSQSQTGPEDDREWITPLGKSLVLVYHDLATNTPLIFISTDKGSTWNPGGTNGMIIGPGDTGFLDTKCNTLVGKPVTDAQGNLYVLTNTSTYAEDAQVGCANVPALDRLYLSVSRDGGHTFTTRLISDLSAAGTGHPASGSWGHTFNQLGIDAAGDLFVDASGTLDGTGPLQNYLLVSTNHGATFSKPIPTHASPDAQVFPSIATGQAGQVAVGYYQGHKPQYQASGNDYQFVIDESLNATSAHPTFTETTLAPLKGTTPHPDGICTDGIFCGTPLSAGGNRNLADFESMTVDPQGHLEVIIPADCDQCAGNTENWFYKQTDGPLLKPGATNGNGTGNQTPVPGSIS